MKRREFIAGLGGAAAWLLVARAQQPAMPVIGYLSAAGESAQQARRAAFRQGLDELGFVEGRNVNILYLYADSRYDRSDALAAELVRRRVAVVVAVGSPASSLAAKLATATTPIVFVLVHPSGIEGLIFGSWAALSGERLSCVGPAEGPGHGGIEIGDELLDPGLQHLLAGEVAAADELSRQNGKPDFDLIEP
jgi:hypothetical protein